MKTSIASSKANPLGAIDKWRTPEHEVVVRSLPKYMFFWPLFLASVAMSMITRWWPEYTGTWTLVFMGVFFLNMLVVAMDFPSAPFFALVIGTVAVVLAIFLIDMHLIRVLPAAWSIGERINPAANQDFYLTMAVSMGIIYAWVILMDLRSCYWVIRPDSIVHHHGFFGNRVEHFQAPSSLIRTDLPDMFEWILLGAGTLMIHPSHGEDIELHHVYRIGRAEARIDELLRRARRGEWDGQRA